MGEQVPRTWARTGLVLTTWLTVLLAAGVIYGFAAFELILKKEGLFAIPGGTGTGAFDATKFNLIISVASAVLAGGSTFVGFTLDLGGPELSLTIAAVMNVGGSLMIAFAPIDQSFWFNIGFACLGYAGSAVLLTSFRAAFVYPQYIPLIMSADCCLFDAASVVFPIMHALYEYCGLSLRSIMIGYAVITGAAMVAAILLWGVERRNTAAAAAAAPPSPVAEVLDKGAAAPPSPTPSRTPVSALPFWQQLRTVEFGFAFALCVVCMWRSNLFLGLANDFLVSLGDDSHGNVVTQIVAWTVPAGVVFIPAATWCLDNLGLLATAYVTIGLGAVYGVMSCLPSLFLQVGTAVVFTMYRALFYSHLSTLTAEVFGMASMGRITGLLYTSAAVLIPLSVLIDHAVSTTLHGSFTVVNVIMTALLALPLLAGIAMSRVTKESALVWPLGYMPLVHGEKGAGQEEGYAPLPDAEASLQSV